MVRGVSFRKYFPFEYKREHFVKAGFYEHDVFFVKKLKLILVRLLISGSPESITIGRNFKVSYMLTHI